MDHDLAVSRRMHVELDPVRSELECASKGWKGVFHELPLGPAMGDSFQSVTFAAVLWSLHGLYIVAAGGQMHRFAAIRPLIWAAAESFLGGLGSSNS